MAGRRQGPGSGDPRFTDRMTTLLQRLEAEPDVSGVTYAQQFPGAEGGADIEVDGDAPGERPTSADLHAHQRRGAESLRRASASACSPGAASPPRTRYREPTPVDRRPVIRRASGSWRQRRRPPRPLLATLGRTERAKVSPWYEIVGIVPAFAETFTPPSGIGGDVAAALSRGRAGAALSRRPHRPGPRRRSDCGSRRNSGRSPRRSIRP